MKPNRENQRWGLLVLLLAACFGVAAVGGWATSSSVESWFPTIAKPDWNPPSWVFGPVWTLLYFTMAVAAWIAVRQGGRKARIPMIWFALQLGLNLGWSLVFFGWRQPGWAFVEILALWVAIVVTTVGFFRLSRLAGALMVPYLGWVTFAAALNFTIWRLNV